MRHPPPGHDLQALDQGRGLQPPVGLHQADDIGAPFGPAAPLTEHGEGLADSGCRAEVDAPVPGDAHRQDGQHEAADQQDCVRQVRSRLPTLMYLR